MTNLATESLGLTVKFHEGPSPVYEMRVTQFCVTQLCPTPCDPMDCSMEGLPVHHQLPEFTQTHVH